MVVVIACRVHHRSFRLYSQASRNHQHLVLPPHIISARVSSESLHGLSRSKHFFPSYKKLFHRGYIRNYLLEEVKENRRREDSKEIVVFWDLTTCTVPHGVDPYRISPNIAISLRKNGFLGPLSIHAYGNTRSLNDQEFLQALVSTGVDLHHIPGGMKNSITYCLVDLLLWVKENLPPARVLLISGDKNFSAVMHKIQMRGYDVLWAHPDEEVSSDVLSLVSEVWAWESIMRGVGVARRSPMSYMPPSNDPLQAYSKEDNKSDTVEFGAKKKPQGVPKVVLNKLLDIIRVRPNGYTLAAFRRQLIRSNIVLDKDFYGHKDLLSFLLSIRELKASLVWTSDRTRAYMFTEASGESVNVRGDNEVILHEERKESKPIDPSLKQMGDAVEEKKNAMEINASQQKTCLSKNVEMHESPVGAAVNKSKFACIWEVKILGMAKRLLSFTKPKENTESQGKTGISHDSKFSNKTIENLGKPETVLDELKLKNDGKNVRGESKIVEIKGSTKRHNPEKSLTLNMEEGNKCPLKTVKDEENFNDSDMIWKERNQSNELSNVFTHSDAEIDQEYRCPSEAIIPKSSEDMKQTLLERSKIIEIKGGGKTQGPEKSLALNLEEGNNHLPENFRDEELFNDAGTNLKEINQSKKLSKVLTHSDSKRGQEYNHPSDAIIPKFSGETKPASLEKSKMIKIKGGDKREAPEKSLPLNIVEGDTCLPENIKDEEFFNDTVTLLKEINQNSKPSKVLTHSDSEKDQGRGRPSEGVISKSSEEIKHPLLENRKDLPSKEDLQSIGFTEEIWKMSVIYLASDKGRLQFTKDNSMENLVKILLGSNITEVAKYQEHELQRLAKLLYSYLHPRIKNAGKEGISEIRHTSSSGKAIERQDNTSKTKTSKINSIESIKTTAKINMAISALDASIKSLVESIVLKDLREMLVCRLKDCKDGVQLGCVKPEFKKKYGYDLNNKVLGHSSLSSLIKTLDGVVMSKDNNPIIRKSRSEPKKQ